ncbi:MAG: urea ABC transporter permease subunit UrtB [Pseudomonadales bacterium]|nr:urea ABC transporter permease subunit UrtB [Pseudomonadales bacterium]
MRTRLTLSGLLGSVLLVVPLMLLAALTQADEAFDQALEQFAKGKIKNVQQGVTLLSNSGDERVPKVLKHLLEGQLYRNRDTDQVVYITKEDEDLVWVVPVAQDDAEPQSAKDRRVKRVGVNNRLRSMIRTTLAGINLKHPEAEKRAAAIRELLGDLDEDTLAILKKRETVETDEYVSTLIATALALADLDSNDAEKQLAAVHLLYDSLEPDVRIALKQKVDQVTDVKLRKEIEKAIAHIEGQIDFYEKVKTVFFGLSLGSILVLAAIGLAITFGVMGVINMAHGELIMIGAYTTWGVQALFPGSVEYSLLIAVPAAFLVSGLVGIAIERGVIKFLYGRPLETLLATFGVSLVLQQAVRSLFGPLNQSVETPSWMSGLLEINPVFSLTLNRLYIILFCFMVFAVLFVILRKTNLGLQVRAVSQNRAMARSMGVRSEWVDAMTFGLGSGIAGVAGVALSQISNVGPNLGQAYIIDSFMVVVFGGVGNLWGTMVAGLSLGVANKFLEPFSGAVLAKILVLIFIILFIQKKPRGLFPQKGRAAEG